MALGQRELYIILRARDEASRILNRAGSSIKHMSDESRLAAQNHIKQGQSLVTIGAAITVAGAAGVKWLNDSTTAAADYNQKTALTLTQVDKVGVKLKDIGDIGLDVAKKIPIPFDEIQGGLYDIFSSMDVSVPQAQHLLTEFSKAGVAGQTDLQTAGRGTIAILNAWHMPASKVNEVNDVMFKLVQKGVGTYEQFSSAIGRAIPSTVRAGGSIQDLAGMMAFMTRNGLSTAQAATSAGRAFDAMSNPKTEKHMKEIGLSVKDASGQFKPMSQIVEELNGKLGKMTAPERAKAMQALFLGSGGTIQARRFFDLAVPGFKQLNTLTGQVTDSSGSMKQAYDTMFKQPQSQVQLLSNQYKAMRVEIGERLLPIKMKLVQWGMKLIAMWENLSPKTQKIIVITIAVTAVLLILAGILIIVAGGILMMMGAAALAGVALAPLIVTILLVVAVIAALIAIVILCIKYHQQIWDFMKKMWKDVLDFMTSFGTTVNKIIDTFLTDIKNSFVTQWNAVKKFWIDTWNDMKAEAVGIWNAIKKFFVDTWNDMKAEAIGAWNKITGAIKSAGNNIKSAVSNVKSTVVNTFKSMASSAWSTVSNGFMRIVNFYKTLPGKIKAAAGRGAGSLLNGIGRQIIQSLINGVNGMIGSLKKKFSDITNMIPGWKGPADVDKKLLLNAGQLTMQGYADGLDKQLPMVKAKLKGLTAQVPALVGSARPVGSASPMAAAPGAIQNFYITTQEIDPRKHAADLGFQIAARVG